MKLFLAAATAAGLVIMGMVASDASAAQVTPIAPVAPVTWGACGDAGLAARQAECGFLSVPLDYAHPSGPKITLALSRVRHQVPPSQYQGIMLVNPGGPGASGLALSALGDFVPDAAGQAYDWIGFDPRGVGASRPALTCDSTYTGYNRPAYVPSSRALERTWLARTRGYARACDAAGGALLDHLKTTDSARDLDSIRRALGVEKINYYGFSYGTYLGQVYATMFPNRVGKMVLDGVVDPTRVWYAANLDQDVAFDRNLDIYFAWLARYDSTYHLGKTGAAVRRLYYASAAALTGHPAGGTVGPDELNDVLLQAGYYTFGWTEIASAFSAWVRQQDATQLKDLYDRNNPQTAGSDNGYAVYLGVQCTDVQWPRSWARWKFDNTMVNLTAPFETWGNAWFNAPCRSWGAQAGRPVTVRGAAVPPILLINETYDAATPYSGALEVRRLFPRAVLLEGVGGTTHAGSLFGNPCVDGTIAAYLKNGALPRRVAGDRSDKQCTPLAPPDPLTTGKIEAYDVRQGLQGLIR